MKTVTATISDPVGFHLRAAGRIVKLTKTFVSEVTIHFEGRIANGKSIMGLASLAAEFGAEVQIEVTGPDEDESAARLVQLIAVELATPETPA
ncbi:MAG: phosphocarrier protein HPr [Candidatus Krumholzibacteriia bacterium]